MPPGDRTKLWKFDPSRITMYFSCLQDLAPGHQIVLTLPGNRSTVCERVRFMFVM